MEKSGLIKGKDGKWRCWWHGDKADYMEYHDQEWGHPVTDDFRLFEKICLEGFQAGLGWYTILRKRENFCRVFAGFDFRRVAKFTGKDVDRLLQDAGIIRHRKKIESTINNAHRAIELQKEFGSLSNYFWAKEPTTEQRPKRIDYETMRMLGKTPESTAISKDLKKRGWSFVGPTTVYAFMQAMGLVNDHLEGCFCRDVVEKKRSVMKRPQ